MKRLYLAIVILTLLLIAPWEWLARAQQQMLVQLATGAATTQTQAAATLANLVVSTTLTARNATGVQLVVKPSSWTVVSQPAISTQASASIAAEAAVRHVADCIGWSADAGGAVTAGNVILNLRDGASGAGTVIWTHVISFPTAAALGIQEVSPQNFCGLNLVGTTNTAMTFEYSALTTNVLEAVNISGYNIQ